MQADRSIRRLPRPDWGHLLKASSRPMLVQLAARVRAGYADVQLHLLIFGSTGGVFKLTALRLKRLGVSHSKLDMYSLLQDMH